jgi:ABC-type transporter Mla subunit MlaD
VSADADAVRAQVAAVQDVALAVRSFSDQTRQFATDARAELRRAVERARAVLQERRQALERARRETAQAEAALARCREDCGGLARALDVARRRQAEAEVAVAWARKAVDIVEQASAAFSAGAGNADRVVEDHGSAAVAACTELAERLKGYLGTG